MNSDVYVADCQQWLKKLLRDLQATPVDDLSVRLLDLDPTRITQVAQVLPDAETWLDPEPADAHSLLLLIASNATRATYSAVIYGIWRWYGLIASVASHIATDSVIFWFVAHHAFYVSG